MACFDFAWLRAETQPGVPHFLPRAPTLRAILPLCRAYTPDATRQTEHHEVVSHSPFAVTSISSRPSRVYGSSGGRQRRRRQGAAAQPKAPGLEAVEAVEAAAAAAGAGDDVEGGGGGEEGEGVDHDPWGTKGFLSRVAVGSGQDDASAVLGHVAAGSGVRAWCTCCAGAHARLARMPSMPQQVVRHLLWNAAVRHVPVVGRGSCPPGQGPVAASAAGIAPCCHRHGGPPTPEPDPLPIPRRLVLSDAVGHDLTGPPTELSRSMHGSRSGRCSPRAAGTARSPPQPASNRRSAPPMQPTSVHASGVELSRITEETGSGCASSQGAE